ncbi:Fe-S cluster assembly ATPase SufC [Aciditerrimonas ferrireducens]|uniref:Fe-S cluster assembly ATPase SufC n=1 Tax=Aciditerrimonas ferrireducens TaxID=667306 RepID=UPI0020031B60|nr:Fe-S cluster assembly ATPase SufC [Aciditerrimonas ferrireducens]MCK4176435.1 Fe-S cluster assembly ATPase SufC [Aciditerrimonas ferrireducens]
MAAERSDLDTGATPPLLALEGLCVAAEDREILHGLDLEVGSGEVHALMGPNGSGKSTLANVIMGNPAYRVTGGRIRFKGEDVTDWPTDVRAKAGIFLAFQHPEAVAGVPVVQFLRQAMAARAGEDRSVLEVRFAMRDWMTRLGIDEAFAQRPLNEGFSGGERKRNEVLQLALLRPELAILDETDSGLDIDALRIVAEGVEAVRAENPDLGILLVTHYRKILDLIRPDVVHVLVDGRLVASGGEELARRLDIEGYEPWRS